MKTLQTFTFLTPWVPNGRRFRQGLGPNFSLNGALSKLLRKQHLCHLQGFVGTNAYNAMKVTFGTIYRWNFFRGGGCAEKGDNFDMFALLNIFGETGTQGVNNHIVPCTFMSLPCIYSYFEQHQ
jgi:hypothetical protein